MIRILVVLLSLLVGITECSPVSLLKTASRLAPRGRRAISNYREAKEALLRHAYGLPMDTILMSRLVEEFGPKIASEPLQPYQTDPIFLIAVHYNQEALVRQWILNGLDANLRSWDNRNAWHAYRIVNPTIREMLNKAGIPKDVKEAQFKLAPLQYHQRLRHEAVVEDLIKSKTFKP